MFTKFITKKYDNTGYTFMDIEHGFDGGKDLIEEINCYACYKTDDVEYMLGNSKWIHEAWSCGYDRTHNNKLQHEDELPDDETYIVTYFVADNHCYCHCVDLYVTKQDIIKNVLAGKYNDGAEYFTIGQAMKTTKHFSEQVEEYKKRESYTNNQLAELCEQIVFNRGISSKLADEEYEMLEVIAERLKSQE